MMIETQELLKQIICKYFYTIVTSTILLDGTAKILVMCDFFYSKSEIDIVS